MLTWFSLAILATASPKLSLPAFALSLSLSLGRDSWRAFCRRRYSRFRAARRFLAASELAFMRSMVCWECLLRFMGYSRAHREIRTGPNWKNQELSQTCLNSDRLT